MPKPTLFRSLTLFLGLITTFTAPASATVIATADTDIRVEFVGAEIVSGSGPLDTRFTYRGRVPEFTFEIVDGVGDATATIAPSVFPIGAELSTNSFPQMGSTASELTGNGRAEAFLSMIDVFEVQNLSATNTAELTFEVIYDLTATVGLGGLDPFSGAAAISFVDLVIIDIDALPIFGDMVQAVSLFGIGTENLMATQSFGFTLAPLARTEFGLQIGSGAFIDVTIPEPASAALMLCGLGLLGVARRQQGRTHYGELMV